MEPQVTNDTDDLEWAYELLREVAVHIECAPTVIGWRVYQNGEDIEAEIFPAPSLHKGVVLRPEGTFYLRAIAELFDDGSWDATWSEDGNILMGGTYKGHDVMLFLFRRAPKDADPGSRLKEDGSGWYEFEETKHGVH